MTSRRPAARRAVTLVTSGHLSTCPRMVKAADALAENGFDVRVVSAQFTEWAAAADADLLMRRRGIWRSTIVDYRRRTAPAAWATTGFRFRVLELLARSAGSDRLPMSMAMSARGRIHSELVRSVVKERCDLIYGSGSAIAAAATSARILGVPYGLDLEDFHSAEEPDTDAQARLMMALTIRIESSILPRAAFLTAGSAGIAREYERVYGVRAIPIDNVFPLSMATRRAQSPSGSPLRMYWFSQTVGAGRGLEDVVVASGMAGFPLELHLRGRLASGFAQTLSSLQNEKAPALSIIYHAPANPDEMVSLASGYDIGLALEPNTPRNRAICLTNKALTYMLGGVAIAITRTEGQQPVIDDVGEFALAFTPGDVQALADGLRRWHTDRDFLRASRDAAWNAGMQRWHWEHPDERDRLIGLVRDAAHAA